MQRKNSILNSSRSAFAMIMAMMVIVVIGTLMALSISMTTQTTKRTTDIYIQEQAMILAKSAAEYALFRISEENNVTYPCKYSGSNFVQDSIYDINISVRYIYTSYPSTCSSDVKYAALQSTDEQNGSVLLDVTVSVPLSQNISSEPIRYFKRTIQKL